MSENVARLVGEILASKVDWRTVLQRFLTRAKTDVRTFARFSRRFIAQGLYLPSISGESMGEIVIAVDCSGSIDSTTLDQFAGEIQAIKDGLNPARVHVVYFDSDVCHYEQYGQDDMLNIQPHGGGGTAFSPVFRYIDKLNVEPVACVFLTDLECSDFGSEPGYPVLWVSNGSNKAPWGEVVMM